MNSKLLALGLTGLLASAPAFVSADTIFGIYAKAGGWSQSPAGGFTDGATLIDMETDLGMSSETGTMFSVAIEHPIPLIPNIKIEQTDLSYNSTSTLTRSITLDGTTYSSSEALTSEVDLSHADFVLYYEILDNWVSLDLGLNIKVFDGGFAIDGATNGSASIELSAPVPMLYGKAQLDLPFSGLSAGAEGSYLGYDGDSLTDYRGYIGYEIMFGFGIELGYRSLRLKFDDLDDTALDTTFEGGYLSATFHL